MAACSFVVLPMLPLAEPVEKLLFPPIDHSLVPIKFWLLARLAEPPRKSNTTHSKDNLCMPGMEA